MRIVLDDEVGGDRDGDSEQSVNKYKDGLTKEVQDSTNIKIQNNNSTQ